MPLPLIPIAMGLAKFLPDLIGHFAGDKAEEVASKAIDIAKTVTGTKTPEEAIKALKKDRLLQKALRDDFIAFEKDLYKEDTKRLAIINSTMKAEYKANDAFVRRWRPFFGYSVALSWLAMMGSVSYAIIFNPTEVPSIINAMMNLNTLYSVALGVLGVSVYQRSQDKKNG